MVVLLFFIGLVIFYKDNFIIIPEMMPIAIVDFGVLFVIQNWFLMSMIFYN